MNISTSANLNMHKYATTSTITEKVVHNGQYYTTNMPVNISFGATVHMTAIPYVWPNYITHPYSDGSCIIEVFTRNCEKHEISISEHNDSILVLPTNVVLPLEGRYIEKVSFYLGVVRIKLKKIE